MRTFVVVLIIFFGVILSNRVSLILGELKTLNKENSDAWDWLSIQSENIEMCKMPVVVSCKTRGLVEEED